MISEFLKEKYLIESILDSSDDGIIIVDATGKVLYANKAVEKVTGLKTAKIIGKDGRYLAEKKIMVQEPIWMKCLREKQRKSTLYKVPILNKVILTTATPCFDSNNDLEFVICNLRNISELESLKLEMQQNVFSDSGFVESGSIYRSLIEKSIRDAGIKEALIIDRKMIEIVELILSLKDFKVNYLITGETGSGKGLIAKIIHNIGRRRDKPLVELNCSAIPVHLLESEVFGYERGAFTGASNTGKAGLLELANKGSVFLDEMGSMPLEIQSKILTFLDEGKIRRLGSGRSISLDVQVIAATNSDLSQEVENGRFRSDLFFRLNEIPIEIPPLRHRPKDIPYLIEFFWDKYCSEFSRNIKLGDTARYHLLRYHYPGNVRELKNIVKRLILSAKTSEVAIRKVQDIAPPTRQQTPLSDTDAFKGYKDSVRMFEKKILEEAYQKYGSTSRAARMLQMNQSTFFRKAKKLGII